MLVKRLMREMDVQTILLFPSNQFNLFPIGISFMIMRSTHTC